MPQPIEPVSERVVTCEICSYGNAPDASRCARCGVPVDLTQCPDCESVNPRAVACCHACGARLRTEMQKQQPLPGAPERIEASSRPFDGQPVRPGRKRSRSTRWAEHTGTSFGLVLVVGFVGALFAVFAGRAEHVPASAAKPAGALRPEVQASVAVQDVHPTQATMPLHEPAANDGAGASAVQPSLPTADPGATAKERSAAARIAKPAGSRRERHVATAPARARPQRHVATAHPHRPPVVATSRKSKPGSVAATSLNDGLARCAEQSIFGRTWCEHRARVLFCERAGPNRAECGALLTAADDR